MFKKYLFLIIIALTLTLATGAQAEMGDLTGVVTPAEPAANQPATIELVSYESDLNRSLIQWFINGNLTKQGLGEKIFNFTTGGAGSITDITVQVATNDGRNLTKSFRFRPENIDILWQADTYVPPFYQGKALPSSESKIKAIALVGGANTTWVYTWTKDGKILANTGANPSQIIFDGPNQNSLDQLEVAIDNLDHSRQSKAKINIQAQSPKIIWYENRPLEGWGSIALPDLFKLASDELSLIAAPYYFPNNDIATNNLVYHWTMNNQAINPNKDGWSITLAKPNQTGEAIIKLVIDNTQKILAGASRTLNITFGANNNNF